MKPKRMYLTLAVFGLLAVGFFTVPLPISRVRDTGLALVDPDYSAPVALARAAVLVEVPVRENQAVKKGDTIARFRSPELQHELDKAAAERAGEELAERLLREASNRFSRFDPTGRLEQESKAAKERANQAAFNEEIRQKQIDQLATCKSPIDGIAMGVPGREELGKQFDPNFSSQKPIMTIADPSRLIVKLPVSPTQYRLLKEDMAANKDGTLSVAVHVSGRTDRVYEGKLKRLPDSDAKQVPPQLTQRGGGPLAVKQAGEGGQETVPVSQTYLVEVEIIDPDSSMRPGTLVQVKVYCQWRSAAWWVRWKLSEALDIGFYQ